MGKGGGIGVLNSQFCTFTTLGITFLFACSRIALKFMSSSGDWTGYCPSREYRYEFEFRYFY